ncbi:MAG: hypothetical protein FJ271_15530 [Planctomycetes bacterium]|nr:hypothetical protein [Planctomycetota bacterium]
MYTELAQAIQQGDHVAETRFRGALEPELMRIVRRALNAGGGSSHLDQRILAEAHLGFWELHSEPQAREAVIRQVAVRMCRNILKRLQTRPTERPGRDNAMGDESCAMTATLLAGT